MAFWGVEVKPGKPFTLKSTESTGTRRLHLSQATLGFGNETIRSILQCNVGNKSPIFLCLLTPNKLDCCQLNLEFEESDEVIFSVIGPRSIHVTGYFPNRSTTFMQNGDESESYGEDIVDTDVDKASSDDYDYSDSFINDDDPSGGVSTDDDEISIKEMASKRKDKKRSGKKGRRLRRKYQVSDSDSDETSARVDDSSTKDVQEEENSDDDLKIPLEAQPSRVTRSKARNSTFENGEANAKSEKTSEAKTHTHKKRESKPLGDIELYPVEKGCEIPLIEKRSKKSSVVAKTEGVNMPERLQNDKLATEKEIKSSSDVLSSQQNGDATLSKKKRKRDKRGEVTDVQLEKDIFESSKSKKQATDKNIEKKGDTKKPVELGISSNGVIIEEIKKGTSDGKSAVKGKKVSILYTGKLKDSGKVFDSNLGEAPLRFRLGGEMVIEGLNIGVEGMRVGDKRRLIIPPSHGFSGEGLKEGVPKNAWLVYEVEAIKIR